MANMRTFMDIASEEATTEENMKNAGLSFDPSYFKAKKEVGSLISCKPDMTRETNFMSCKYFFSIIVKETYVMQIFLPDYSKGNLCHANISSRL